MKHARTTCSKCGVDLDGSREQARGVCDGCDRERIQK